MQQQTKQGQTNQVLITAVIFVIHKKSSLACYLHKKSDTGVATSLQCINIVLQLICERPTDQNCILSIISFLIFAFLFVVFLVYFLGCLSGLFQARNSKDDSNSDFFHVLVGLMMCWPVEALGCRISITSYITNWNQPGHYTPHSRI